MRTRIEQVGPSITVALEGAFDMTNGAALRLALLKAAGRTRNLVVDLGRVSDADSSTVACLVEALQCEKGRGGRLTLAHTPRKVRRLLKLSRMERLFPLSDAAVR